MNEVLEIAAKMMSVRVRCSRGALCALALAAVTPAHAEDRRPSDPGASFFSVPAGEEKRVKTISITAPPPPAATHMIQAATQPQASAQDILGSGFFVNMAGDFVTSAHVVNGCAHISIRPDGGVEEMAKLIASDAEIDIAVLHAGVRPKSALPIGSSVRLGEEVATFGYPYSSLLGTTGSFSMGNVTALAGAAGDQRSVMMSVPIQIGNSGGALINARGNVVGVVRGKLGLEMLLASGDLPQNVNFATNAETLRSFLMKSNVEFDKNIKSTTNLTGEEAADLAKAQAVMVKCEK